MAARILSVVIVTAIVFAAFWLLLVAPLLQELTQAIAGARP